MATNRGVTVMTTPGPTREDRFLETVVYLVLKWIARRYEQNMKVSNNVIEMIELMAEIVNEDPVDFFQVNPETWEPIKKETNG
jgi:hypothetical protein